MAVLYQAKGSATPADARYDIDRATNPVPATSGKTSSFFYKHVRIYDTLPDRATMENVAQQIWDARKQSPGSTVVNALGEQRKKKDVYGTIKPPASTTLFVTPGGFQSLNAYIEEFVTETGDNWVPIPGGGVVVTRKKVGEVLTSEFFDAGYWELGIQVGDAVGMGAVKGVQQSFRTKVVYHFGDVAKSASAILAKSGHANAF
jgi:hypothetical protein